MKTPQTSSLFTPWKSPATGIQSYILTERAAPVQQSFYFATPEMTDDGRYLWLGCGYPPPGGKHAQQVLGVVDFESDTLRVYHETQFATSRPLVDLATGEVYWWNQLDLWKRGPGPDDRAVRINRFPADWLEGRLVNVATHPTFSPDKKQIHFDAQMFRTDGTPVCLLGIVPLDGSPPKLWLRTEGQYQNHAMLNPTRGDEMLFANDHWHVAANGPFDGQTRYHRVWTVRPGQPAKPLLKEPPTHSGHEWWEADGQHISYVHYGHGIKRVNVATGAEEMTWPGRWSHGDSDNTGRYLVADWMESPSISELQVFFRDTQTGKQVEVARHPALADGVTQCTHLHPHPHFVCDDRYICYTTIVHDRVDVALVPTADLIRATEA